MTDAYYAGTTSYVQALRAAAQHGVDVRLLVPNGTDIPLLRPLSRAGYRSLLEAGVRVFEWNGTMLHAKTAVADGHWARVGSTNLNIASWFGNCELDAVIEDDSFALQMEQMYLEDLTNATEVVLNERQAQSKRDSQPSAVCCFADCRFSSRYSRLCWFTLLWHSAGGSASPCFAMAIDCIAGEKKALAQENRSPDSRGSVTITSTEPRRGELV